MRSYIDSDIFEYFDKGSVIQNRIFKILASKSGAIILNNKLEEDIRSMRKIFKESVVVKVIAALNSGDMLLVQIPPEFNLPEGLPFIKHKKDGKERMIINVTKYVVETKDRDTGEIEYSIDIKKLYSLCVPGYLYLTLFDSSYTPSPDAMKSCAIVWSGMFNKVLIRTIGLTTNKERYEAFMYFGIKFFLKYFLDQTDTVVDKIADSYLMNGKGYLIEYMESKIDVLGLKPYESFTNFCHTLFNNEVSNIKGIRVNNVEENMNVSFYLKKFIDMYNMSAIMALASFPLFIFTVFSAFNWSNIVNDRSFEELVYSNKKEVPKIMISFYKDFK